MHKANSKVNNNRRARRAAAYREQQKVLAISCALAALGKYWPLHWLRNISSRFKLIPPGLSACLDGWLEHSLA
jgi:hypothetical protein